MYRIQTIIDKEWAEVFKNKMVFWTIVLLPLLFTAMPLIFIFITSGDLIPSEASDMPASFAAVCGTASAKDCLQIYMINQFLLMFMMMPVIIPITIAAYSIVGEKATRSLEPLLATPITTEELLTGKVLASAIPAVAVTMVFFAIFVALTPLAGGTPALMAYMLSSTWLIAILLVGPLMAIASTIFAVIVSSRVNDPRVAEQISAVFILPVMLLLFGQLAGWLVINVPVMLIFSAVMAAANVGLIYLAARVFQREQILTRWK